jgi:hypothetical protein
MLNGLSGSLLSHYFAERLLDESFAGQLGEAVSRHAQQRLARWWAGQGSQLGPASSVRAIWDQGAAPLAEILGFTVSHPEVSLRAAGAPGLDIRGAAPSGLDIRGAEAPGLDNDEIRCSLLTSANSRMALLVGHWSNSLDTLWRKAVRTGIGFQASWCLCTNGRDLRLVDTERTYSRAYLQFDLERAIADPRTFAVFWGAMRAEAFQATAREGSLIAQIIQRSASHGEAVSRSLRSGVIDAVQQLLVGLLATKGPAKAGHYVQGPANRLRQGYPPPLGYGAVAPKFAGIPRTTADGGQEAGRYQGSVPETNDPDEADLSAGFDESLTIVYRWLFLMFAEARGLVPNWHPIYRDSYTIESLRVEVERTEEARGLWETLQAIARLAHRGCRAGTLVVAPFNGRLFSPSHAPLAESRPVNDSVARNALMALSTTANHKLGRTRIDYRDLGVEQLGAIYETVLEYVPRATGLKRGGDRRKATGSFYTPQSITDYVVRRTLHPLAEHASAEHILALRIVDPAMGSAAFLVAACRYLARAYERALLREGSCHEGEIDESDRAGFRRLVAQRCLFGVDLNPTAVQLARLSLWLATLAAGKPLSFLDHHLVCGDSLLGASPIDLARQPPPRRRQSSTRRRNIETPLFLNLDLEPSLAHAVLERRWLADTGDDTLEIVREKEKRLGRLAGAMRWKALADLWCACWMWPEPDTAPGPAVFAALIDVLTHGRSTLPEKLSSTLLDRSRAIAQTRRFFHWMLEFPEVYFDASGEPLPNAGFDAVLGNPPWDMLRADSGDAREAARSSNTLTKHFFRNSGIYRYLDGGHINRYQVFLERALTLTRRGGRLGLLLPSGLATDHTSASLRRRLLEQADIDTLTGFDNRNAIFPIHRSVRFLICTATNGRPTQRIKCRFGIDNPGLLETIPDSGDRPGDPVYAITLTPPLIRSVAGDKLTIPDLRTAVDLAIVERIAHRFPRLGDHDGWNVRFGRELNATEDRRHFHTRATGLPVLEGKHIEPFRAHVERSCQRILEKTAAQLLDAAKTFGQRRLAYRDVASSTNRLSLIAAILPAGVVTTHSLFCLKTFLVADDQEYLCAMLNSFVANYLVRQVMTTHLGSTTVEELRVPKLAYASPAFGEIVELAIGLRTHATDGDAARLQALAAHNYGLTIEDFRHVLSTFPLVSEAERSKALEEFERSC